MAPVAKEISTSLKVGVLEPFQTADSVDGQVVELRDELGRYTAGPPVLAGHSWGAWLIFILAARYPGSAGALVLVGAPPFEEKYAGGIEPKRLGRLSPEERLSLESLRARLNVPGGKDRDCIFAELGELLSRADSYDPLPRRRDAGECRRDIFEAVWPEAVGMRDSGVLLELGKEVRCPVIAVHGDYDPHPAAGVAEPLQKVLADFRFVLLEQCGHTPWLERQARERFFEELLATIREAG